MKSNFVAAGAAFLLLIAFSAESTAQQKSKIYKWTDANGKVHYSATPPPQANTEEIKVRGSNVSTPTGDAVEGGASRAQTSAPPRDSKPDGEAAIAEMCKEAVRWTFQVDLPNLREIGRDQVRAGHVTAAEFNSNMRKLEAMARNQVTEGKCRASRGEDRKGYECLSKGGGLVGCSGALKNL